MRIVVDRCRHFLGNFVSNNVSSCLLSLPIEPISIVTDNDLFYSLFSVTIARSPFVLLVQNGTRDS